jgi:Tol biopolymer transport system component
MRWAFWAAALLAMLLAVITVGVVVGGLMRKDIRSAVLSSDDRRLNLLFSSAQEIYDSALSPDGKTLVYVAQEQDQFDLFVTRAAGGGRVRVTNDLARESHPQFSPDGEKILFTRLVPGTDVQEICVTAAFGGEVTPLIHGAEAVWSPDASRFVFIRQQPGEPPALAVADANGGNVRTIMQADATYRAFDDPAWSPDGRQIAVVRSMGGVSGEIWMTPAAGGQPRRLWQDSPEVFSHGPVFALDGRAIVHSSNRGGATNVWSLPLDGSAPVRLTTGSGPDEYPSIARDGTIAFTNSRSRWTLVVYGSDLKGLSGTAQSLVVSLGAVCLPGRQGCRIQQGGARWLLAHLDSAGRRRRGASP